MFTEYAYNCRNGYIPKEATKHLQANCVCVEEAVEEKSWAASDRT